MSRSAHLVLPSSPYLTHDVWLAAAQGGGLARARRLAPEEVIAEVARSGLRGRGGAGFPAGVKWASVAAHPCPTRDVVCNAAEGEPGTFKDRALIRANPYAVIEGVLIGAHAIGARAAWIALKASFRREVERLRAALAEMEAAGVLGGLPVHVFEGPEDYLFGEEKALLDAIEGLGAFPRLATEPPYERGLFATPGSPNPALVSNAETFARAATVLAAGAESFRALGTADTPGPIIVTLSGDVARTGVFEVEAGVPLGRVLHDLGGGPLPGRRFKALLSGVSSGALALDPAALDIPCDFGSLARAGAGLGSAGFMAFDDRRSMPRLAQAVARFLARESCAQCSACKSGLTAAAGALSTLHDPRRLHATGAVEAAVLAARRAPQGNRCYLPVQGAVLVPSLVRAFPAEFAAREAAPGFEDPVVLPKIVDRDAASGELLWEDAAAGPRAAVGDGWASAR